MPLTTTGQVWPSGAPASSAAPLPIVYGVPSGTALTTFSSANNPLTSGFSLTSTRYTISSSYTFTNWRFNHRVLVNAGTVNFVNCRFAGAPGDTTSGSVGVFANDFANGSGTVTCTNCTFIPSVPYESIDGVRGGRMTLDHCDIASVVDGMNLSGGAVTVRFTWIHDLPYYDNNSHPTSPPTGTHNDCAQITNGTNFLFEDNLFDGAGNNAVFMIKQDSGTISNLTIRRNKFDMDDCASDINLYDGAGAVSGAIAGLNITNNTFNHNSTHQMLISSRTLSTASPVISGNVWIDGATPPPSPEPGASGT